MARFSLKKLPEKERIRLIGEFYDVISMIKNRDEAAKVFRDIMDGDEIGNIMRRIDVAILIFAGMTYDEISELLKVGKDKITRVQKKINQGGEGYSLLITRILEARKKRKINIIKSQRRKLRKIEKPNSERLKKNYPLHFLFHNILDELEDHLVALSEIDKPEDFYKKRVK